MMIKSANTVSKSVLGSLSVVKYGIRYSREYLRSLDVDHEAIKLSQQQHLKLQTQKALYNLPNNQKNEKNRVKVRINSVVFQGSKSYQAKKQEIKTCAIINPQPRPKRKLISAIRKHIITSIKKSKDAMHCIRRKNVFDAITNLMQSHKKVAKLMLRTFYNLIDHAMVQGMNPFRLFVHGALIGKTRRFKSIRYHGKARTGRQKRDFCQIRIVLYEKEQAEFNQQVAFGQCPPAVAAMIRKRLTEQGATYSDMLQYSGITTAKGRQQAKVLIKRRVNLKMQQNTQKGIFIPKKILLREQISEKAEKVKELLRKLQTNQDSLKRRQILYKKNSADQ